ncbi:hypothetical protein L1887_19627 [Cichorium endivia]|nr:hypothetical protein L1887_19627 [Cichorium endivia]
MEPDVSIETSSEIRIAVIPIGIIHPHQFRDYVAMLDRHQNMELSAISSFYTAPKKPPFPQQPWDSGYLRFKYVIGGSPPSPWEDFQSYRKIHGVIGICHCPSSPDLDSVVTQFVTACKLYSSSLIQRCFAFSPGDSQLENESKKRNKLVFFPPTADQRTQEFHLQTMMQDLAASLVMEFEKCVVAAKSSGTLLKTPLDSQASLSAEEAMKARKRRDARAHKTIGDYCLLAGSPVDANNHYSDALELARTIGDYFWYAGALEGSVSAFLMGKTGETDASLVEEVKYRYNGVITHYRKSFTPENSQRVSPLSFELEATLKLARFLCRPELVKEVVELLTTATDGAKSLIDTSDRLILYVEIARLFGSLGYHRKAAFFSRQVAQLYMQQENNLAASSALQVLALTTKAYRVQSRASIFNETGQYLVDSGKVTHHLVVSLFESQWSTLQMVVLKEILLSAVRAGDPLAAWSAAARLIRSYYPLITPPGQNRLANALVNSADRLPSGTHSSDPALPFIRLHSFPHHFSQMDIIKRNPNRQDWWAGSAPSGPFIYTPFSKRESISNSNSKHDLIWVIGEPVQVLVELANPCGFDLLVNSIYLSVHSSNFDAFPVSVTLPSNSSKVVSLSGVPTKEGTVSIPGCIVHCFGVLTEHFFKDVDNLLLGASQGLVFSDPFRCCGSAKQRNITVPNITVVPRLPLLVSHVVGGDSAIILYEGEIRELWISFANAGTVPIEQANISLSGKNQDSVVSIGFETLKSALPLKPGAEVIIPVTLKAWQLGLDPDTANKRQLDGSSPVLLIHYAGPTGDPMPPGRRLVAPLNICVLQGLSFMKARLLSMEIPAHVGGVSENIFSSDSIVKIDPFRGSWGLRFLEFELYNPTDVVFEVTVSVVDAINTDDKNNNNNNNKSCEFTYPKTRIDRDYTSRVLIPLEHFKLPVLDGSVVINIKTKAELNASIKDLISKIKVRWQSGRNSVGELHIKDATQAALQTSVMDVLLPDPLTFGFRLVEKQDSVTKKGSVAANEMTPMAVIVRNNTKDCIKMSLSITCRDVAGENCIEGYNPTVLWAGTLIGVNVEIPPLKEIKHSFSLYFLVPGEYTLLAAAVIDEPNEILRARARSASFDEPIVCRGPPYHVRVHGIV